MAISRGLRERRQSLAGYTSGGEQQMCAIGRALMSNPKMILLDEPSMGLAPQIVEEIFTIMKSLNESEGVSFLLAEQNANLALKYSGHGYILENGRVVLDGSAATLHENSLSHPPTQIKVGVPRTTVLLKSVVSAMPMVPSATMTMTSPHNTVVPLI